MRQISLFKMNERKRQRLSGAHYKAIAKIKKKREDDVIKKTRRLDYFLLLSSSSFCDDDETVITIENQGRQVDGHEEIRKIQIEAETANRKKGERDVHVRKEVAACETERQEDEDNTTSTSPIFKPRDDPFEWKICDDKRNYFAQNGFKQHNNGEFFKSKKEIDSVTRRCTSNFFFRKLHNNETINRD